MEKTVNLCMGCMNELGDDGVCHYCSYTDDAPYLQSYLAPKTVLDDRYVIGKMLSYNGEGASYICYDTVSKCKCVCREYMPDALCERETKTGNIIVNPACLAKYKTYMSEFADINKTLSKMRNLNKISTAKDMFYANNTTYIILEYVEGVSLKKFLQTNTGFLSWEQVKKLFMPLFTTLNIVHKSGIIHRGISPENIIVTTDCELKLTGFSISSIRTSNTGLIPEFYSGYTAPEQYDSLEWQGTWTDVYSLAAVIYRILTGCVPLDGLTRMKNDTLVEASKINPAIPKHISDVLSKAMAVKGSERIQTVDELVTELFEKNTVTSMEHSKGSTQTIPIQHKSQNIKKKKNSKKKNPPKKKTSRISLILGWGILLIAIAASIVLLVELFSTPDKEDTDSTSQITATTERTVEETDETDEYMYSVTAATPEPAETEKKNKYGYGAIMPSVINMDIDLVMAKLGNSFSIRTKYYYSDTDEKGLVVSQSIKPGADYDPLKKNTLVLKVCAGPAIVYVPDYSGNLIKPYLATLDSMNIKYAVSEEPSVNVEKDYVIKTSIKPGNPIDVSKGTVLRITVSSGSKGATATTASTRNSKADEGNIETNQPAVTEKVKTVAPQ